MENFFLPLIGIAVIVVIIGLCAYLFERQARNKAEKTERMKPFGGGGPGAGGASSPGGGASTPGSGGSIRHNQL